MNRRKFLKWLGVGVAAGAVAPAVLLKKEPAVVADAADQKWDWYYRSRRAQIPVEKRGEEIGGWVSYRVKFTVCLPPNRSQRIRFIEAMA